MMAPILVVFTTLLVAIQIFVIDCKRTTCTDFECRSNKCPTVCSCLGSLVDCSKRGLVDVPKDLPVWVQMLDLQNNDISTIDENAFNGLWKLTDLDLSNNQLFDLNVSTLQQLKSLQKLIVNNNRLVELPYFVQGHPLAVLHAQHNEIHTLNASFLENLPGLHILDLSFNSITDLHADSFGNSSSLRHLSLSHNKISNMERGVFDNLTALESLKLNKNKLTTIPKELFRHLNSLRHLEMNSNSLSQIDGLSFQGLSSLNVLKLRHGGISHLLDGAFYGLNSIKKLQLDYNNISRITKGWLYGLNSLQRLYLNFNNISEIEDDAWDSGKRLLELDMTHNRLQFITVKTFDKLYSLKRLILSDNMITYIEEGAFQSLSTLQYLELENNKVSWTIEDSGKAFSGLDRLKYLGLSNNNIRTVIKKAFSGLSRLETLNLTNNHLITIEENSFDDLPHLHELLINSSNLLCDCNLSWMRSFQYHVIAKCGYPIHLKGLSVFDVPMNKFICVGHLKPLIVKEPHTKITLKGENVTLVCQAKSTSDSDMIFQWQKDGKLLKDTRLWSKNTSLRQGNFTLHTSFLFINNIQDKDEGRYQCVISNEFGSVYSNKARITVHVFPVFTKTPIDVTIKTGSTARLECGARGQPMPDITWRKDGGDDFPAARERRMHVMPSDDVFFIGYVKASDTGVYSCTAQNVAGVITANVTLTVLETPSFVKEMEDKEIRAGETAVLECMSAGSPKPKLTWFKDGASIQQTERHFFTAENQLFIILQSQVSDNGVYSCEMSNTLGTKRGSSHLKILTVDQSGAGIEEYNTIGIIVIAVVVGVVVTSIVWVIIIHYTRKTRFDFASNNPSEPAHSVDVNPYNYRSVFPKDLKASLTNVYLDSHSGHSKDSGTGDSAQPSDDILIEEDEQGLLLNAHSSSKNAEISRMSSILDIQDSAENSQTLRNVRVSANGSVSKEKVPLLHMFRANHSHWKFQPKSVGELNQKPETDSCKYFPAFRDEVSWSKMLVHRSLSADQVNCNDILQQRVWRGPNCNVVRVDSDCTERDSGFSTFPRSITQASVSNWSMGSPRLHRLPKDIPNDSGSFSVTSEDIHSEAMGKCTLNASLPSHHANIIS